MPEPGKPALWRQPRLLIPLGLFVASLLIRLVGITWGLPNELHNQSYHPDEDVNVLTYSPVLAQQLGYRPQDSMFVPGHYNYGTAYFIALSVVGSMATTYNVEDWCAMVRHAGPDIRRQAEARMMPHERLALPG